MPGWFLPAPVLPVRQPQLPFNLPASPTPGRKPAQINQAEPADKRQLLPFINVFTATPFPSPKHVPLQPYNLFRWFQRIFTSHSLLSSTNFPQTLRVFPPEISQLTHISHLPCPPRQPSTECIKIQHIRLSFAVALEMFLPAMHSCTQMSVCKLSNKNLQKISVMP